MHLAAFNGHQEIAKILLNMGPSRADVNEIVRKFSLLKHILNLANCSQMVVTYSELEIWTQNLWGFFVGMVKNHYLFRLKYFQHGITQLTFTCLNSMIETLGKVWNMFRVKNKNARTMSLTSSWCFYGKLWRCFTPFSSVFVVDLPQVHVSWVHAHPKKWKHEIVQPCYKL